jgi:hypothetical protein
MLNKLLIVLSIFFALGSNVYAAKIQVRIPAPDGAMSNCVIDGGEYRESANYFACCSGPTECVVCEKGAGGACQYVSISKLNSFGFKNKAPSSAGDFIAPAPKSTSPRDRLKRNAPPAFPAKNKTPTKTTPKTEQKKESLKSNTQLK